MHDNTLDAYLTRIRRKLRDAGAPARDRDHPRRRLHPANEPPPAPAAGLARHARRSASARDGRRQRPARQRVHAETPRCCARNADAQVAALSVAGGRVHVRESAQRRDAGPALVGARRRSARRAPRRCAPAARPGGRRAGPAQGRARVEGPATSGCGRSRSAPQVRESRPARWSSPPRRSPLERLQQGVLARFARHRRPRADRRRRWRSVAPSTARCARSRR